MSRIGRMPIPVPAGVKVEIDGQKVTVKGPKGELTHLMNPGIKAVLEGNVLHVQRESDAPQVRALHGLNRALINNMVVGVSQGYSKSLEVSGTGYKVELQGKTLVMSLGFSHDVRINPPDGISFEVNPKTGTIVVKGADKQMVGKVAAEIRAWRPVEPYLGKGIRYSDEIVRRKAGKSGKAGGKGGKKK